MADRNTKINGNQIKDATVTEDELSSSIAGAGIAGGAGSALSVNVDGSSIEVSTDTLQVKASGITNAMLAGSIADGKLASDYVQTSEVDGSTIEFGVSLNVKALGIDTAQLAANAVTAAKMDLTDTYDFSSGTLRSGTPSASTDVANKSYVDGLANGVDWKGSVRIASDQNSNWTTAASIAFSTGTLTITALTAGSSRGLIDVVEPVDGDRILIKDAGAAFAGAGADDKYNGLWEVTGGTTTTLTLTRTTDADADAEVNAGLAVFVAEGAVNADEGYVLTTNDPITVDTTALVFTQFTGVGSIVAGDGLAKAGNTLSVNVDNSSIEISADTLQVKASGITNAMLAGSIADGKLASDYVQTSEVDGSTIEFGASLNVKALGIDTAQLAANAVTADKIAAAVAGDGLAGGAGSALSVDLNELTAAVVDVANDSIAIVDATDSGSKKEAIADLVAAMAGTGITATAGVLSADAVTDNITEASFVKNVEIATGSQTVMATFSGSAAVVANSVQVYLNGLVQEEGAGNDYTINLSTGVVTFLVGLDAGDIVTSNGVLNT